MLVDLLGNAGGEASALPASALPAESAAAAGGTAPSWAPGLVLILRMLVAAAPLR